MKTLFSLTILVLIVFTQYACNPECESLQGVRLSSNETIAGQEILVTATPLSSLQNKKVSIGNIPAESQFYEDFGLVVKVPVGLNGDLELRIEDPDCLDFVRVPLSLKDENYFSNNLNYVSPNPPVIIIPTVNINPPQFVNNAWLCPENPDYCIWFKMVVDSTNPPTYESKLIDPVNSFEQASCPCMRSSNLLYAQNRMFGIVDKDNNYIEITIDRTKLGGGFETYKGRFIDINQEKHYSAGWDTTVTCFNQCVFPANSGIHGYMMLLTSQRTGRQLSVYQKKP